MTALQQLLALIDDVHAYNHAPENLLELQLAAAQERFAERRQQVAVLDKRARDVGIDSINSLDDLVPLLFSHTNYKSYPETFIAKGRWDMMNRWLETMSSHRLGNVDLAGIQDVDDWMARMRDVGHPIFASSGTSGKASFLFQTSIDRDRTYAGFLNQILWQIRSLKPDRSRACFCAVPRYSPHRFTEINVGIADAIGTPGKIKFLTEIPTLVSDTNRMGAMRTRIADGSATPEEIEAFEREAAVKAERMAESITAYYDAILDHRHEPLFIVTMWQFLYGLRQRGLERGIPEGDFHPAAAVMIGGGLKGANLPPDFKELSLAFLGVSRENLCESYGMVEMQTPFPWCREVGGFTCTPWVIPLILDKTGEKLLNPPPGQGGIIEGRLALFDLSLEGRWGGLITGDKVTVDFDRHPEACGPFFTEVNRYKDLAEGEDKLSCAGTIDSYVRGAIRDD